MREQWFHGTCRKSFLYEWGHMTPEWAEPVTVVHPQSHPGRGERRGDEASIFTAKGCGRCLEPKRSLTEARGRCARGGHFQQALGRRHTQGGWQHQRHGGPPGTNPAVPARRGARGRQSEVRGPAGRVWARLLDEWHRCGGSHTACAQEAPITCSTRQWLEHPGSVVHSRGAQEAGLRLLITVGPWRESKQ